LVANLEGNVTGNVTGQVSTLSNHDTDNLSEGSSSLYFTNARARSAISASGDISYNSSTGVISFTASAAPVTSVNSATGAVVLDTGDIAESGNLYFTNARARAAISEGSTQLSYNSGTGVLTFTQGNSDTVAEGSSNLYYTDTRVATKIDSYVDKAFIDNLSVVAASATGNSGSATILQTARTIAGVSFDGSANISLDTSNITEDSSYLYYTDARANSAIDARVTNTFINNLSGVVADTSTALATGRTIGMTGDVVWTSASFDGSGNVTGSATIQADAVEQSMIADDAVGADQLAASSVVTAAVVDDAITQAKMAANSIGITELNVSDGTNGQALKTDGSGNLSFGDVSVSQTLTVVGRAANVAITITSGVLGVIARSGTINVGV